MDHLNRKPFLLHPRPSKKFKQIYYVQFRLADGTFYTQSSGQATKSAAETWAIEQIKQGLIPDHKAQKDKKRVDLVSFLMDFWDYDNSKYVQGKLARGGTISRSYCRIMGYMVNKYVKPAFNGREIRTLTADDFDGWMAGLAAKKIPAKTINQARISINVALNYLVSLRHLQWNPLRAVKPYREVFEKREILTVEEFQKLLTLDGLDLRVRVAIALGGLCGMRMGEIRGLRWKDVDTKAKILRIHTSYVEVDGERDQAKHGSNRVIPLPSPVADILENWRNISPAIDPDDWVVCSTEQTKKPFQAAFIRDGFYDAVRRIEIKDSDTRKIVFHSLRHWYNTQLRGTIPEAVLRRFTGHRNAEMTDHYDAGKEIDFQKARNELEKLLKPKKGKKTAEG